MPSNSEFDALVTDHLDAVRDFAWRLTGSRQDAEDVAQQTFFQAFRAWPRFEHRSTARTWLIRIAVRVTGRILSEKERRPQPWSDHADNAPDPLDVMARDEEARLVRGALLDLAPIHRLVLTLFTIDGLSHREIAEILECPVGTVWSRLHHAKAALQKRLDTGEVKRLR